MASYNITKIGFLADFWKFWFCPKVAHFYCFLGIFSFNSFYICGSCTYESWYLELIFYFLILDTKGYWKSGIGVILYISVWMKSGAQNACNFIFGTEEVFFSMKKSIYLSETSPSSQFGFMEWIHYRRLVRNVFLATEHYKLITTKIC